MKVVDKVLSRLESCLETGTYQSIETDKIELKDLSRGPEWKELYKSVCAFLNSQGGIVILGVHENTKKKAYKFTNRRFSLLQKNQKVQDVKEYNDYKRKIRAIINNLTKKDFIVKSESSRPSYTINKNRKRTSSLFD